MLKLDFLLEQIISQIKATDQWQLSLPDLLEYTDSDLAGLYQTVYKLGRKIDQTVALEGFSMVNSGVLLTFLEQFSKDDLEERFTRAGLFIPYSLGVDFNAFIVQFFHDRGLLHRLRQEDFRAMLAHTENIYKAIDIYRREFFSFDDLLEAAVSSFMETKQTPEWSFPVYMGFCQLLLPKKPPALQVVTVRLCLKAVPA